MHYDRYRYETFFFRNIFEWGFLQSDYELVNQVAELSLFGRERVNVWRFFQKCHVIPIHCVRMEVH